MYAEPKQTEICTDGRILMNTVKGWMSPTRRAVWQWTGLPREVVDLSALGSFKKKLYRLLSEMLQEAGGWTR